MFKKLKQSAKNAYKFVAGSVLALTGYSLLPVSSAHAALTIDTAPIEADLATLVAVVVTLGGVWLIVKFIRKVFGV